MVVSELICHLSVLADQYGDLEILADCDSVLTRVASVELFSGPYEDLPAIVICPPPQDATAISGCHLKLVN